MATRAGEHSLRGSSSARVFAVLVASASAASAGQAPIVDCNQNGVDDTRDIIAPIRFDAPALVLVSELDDSTDFSPSFLVTADLDLDGDDDLAMLQSTGYVTLLESVAGGFFGPPVVFGIRAPAGVIADGAGSVAVGDLDGDGDLDFATANSTTNTISLIFSRAPFVLDAPRIVVVPDGPASIVAGDLDLDGRTDLAVACGGSEHIAILERDSNDILWTATRVAIDGQPGALVLRDLDGDGRQDFVVAMTRSDAVGILWNTTTTPGELSFAEPAWIDGLDEPIAVAIADFDGDRRLDLAVANRLGSNVSVLRSSGMREFAPAVNFHSGDDPKALAALDFDADGALDLAVANGATPGVVLLRNRGDGTFESARELPGITRARHLAAGDFDRDGRIDLIATTVDSRSAVLFANRDGRFPTLGEPVLSTPVRLFVAADLDGDLDADLVVARSQENVVEVLSRRGLESFESVLVVATERPVARLDVVDLDADGAPEIIVDEAFDRILIARNDGRGGFLPTFVELSVRGDVLAIEDLDGDGWKDLIVRDGARTVHVPNDRRGGFGSDAAVELPAANALVFGDLDGDRTIDFVDAVTGSTDLRGWFNHGDGSFELRFTMAFAEFLGPAALHDFDGDGRPEFIVADRRTIHVLRNRGDGSFADPGLRFGTGSAGTRSFAVLDLDLDGHADLVAADTRGLRILRGTGGLEFESVNGVSVGGAVTTFGYSDFDLDGDIDVLFVDDGILRIVSNETPRRTSRDDNDNGVPDECEGRPFHRGDANNDGCVDLTDAVRVLAYLFLGERAPSCRETADIDNDGSVALDDAVLLLDHLFRGGAAPAIPGAPPRPCAPDPDPRASARDLGCDDYTAC